MYLGFTISLTQKHDGDYLAQVVADCMIRYGLEKRVSTTLVSVLSLTHRILLIAVLHMHG